ncbi:unnamed protein product [Closterium sp. NIES-54]
MTFGAAAMAAHASLAPPTWGSIPSGPPSVPDSQGSFLGHVAAAPSVASMYPSAINETSFQYPVSPPLPSSPTLDFVLDSGATHTALKEAGTLTPLPLPTQVHGADSSFSIPCTHLSTLPCTAFPSGKVPAVVINWAEQCRNHFKRPIGRLHSDGGGEFINNTLATFCKLHGIQQTSTLPHSPQQNGIAESRIREITKISHCLIAHASTPPSLWSYALLHAALLLNLRSHPQHSSSSPTELWSKAKPDVASLRVWGCKSFVLIPPADCSHAAGKLAPRALERIYLGHNRDSSGYLFLHPPTNRLIRSIDVVFDESIPYYSTPPPDPLPPPSCPLAWTDTVLPPLLPPSPLLPPVAAPLPPSSSADVYDPAAPASPAHSTAPPPPSPSSSHSPSSLQRPGQLQQQQQRQRQPGQQQGPQQQQQQQPLGQQQQKPGQQQQQQQQPGQQQQQQQPTQQQGQQQQQQQVQQQQQQQRHRATSRSSPFLLPRMHTFSLDKVFGAPSPASIQILEDSHAEFLTIRHHTPFLASIFHDFLGLPILGATSTPSIFTPSTFKEAIACPDADRWIASIFLECEAFIRNDSFVDVPLPADANLVEGKWTWAEDYWFTYAPTTKPPTLRTLLDVGARDDMEICSMDVSNAILQGDLHERIFLRRPPGFHAAFPENTVWQLRRPVYGLKQAPRDWHAKLSATLGSLGFSASHSDASLFFRSSPRRFFILVYVDDMILLADSKADMEQMKQQL